MSRDATILYDENIKLKNPSVFEAFYAAAMPIVYRRTMAILRNHHNAEEATNWTFFKASQNDFRGEGTPIGWVTRIATNEANDILRKGKSRHEFSKVSIDDAGESETRQLAVPPNQVRSVDPYGVQVALKKLSDEDRNLVLAKHLEGRSVDELHQETGLNENTIKVKLFRARQRLRKELKKAMRPNTTVLDRRRTEIAESISDSPSP
jgi:RNA polymerase sigma-70 factor (ECF subfamily)